MEHTFDFTASIEPFGISLYLNWLIDNEANLLLLKVKNLVYLRNKANNLNLIKSLKTGKDKVHLNILQFVDDTLIFVPLDEFCIDNYFRILDIFALMSGLRLNYSKSCFITWNTSDYSWAKELARSVGCIHSKCLVIYLGLPLGDNMNRRSTWKPVLEKIQAKLASRKARILSRAGRLTLIKSMLNNLPIYYMSMFKLPKTVSLQIVKVQRRFFWRESNEGKMPSPTIKWSSIELPKDIGGLGAGNILYKNLILLFKRGWRYSEVDNTLWKHILLSVC